MRGLPTAAAAVLYAVFGATGTAGMTGTASRAGATSASSATGVTSATSGTGASGATGPALVVATATTSTAVSRAEQGAPPAHPVPAVPDTVSPQAASSAQATLDRAMQAYTALRTLRANFVQVVTNPLTGTTDTARGTMVQRRPALLSVRFTDPAGDRIVADGRALWVYLPSTTPGQVMRLPTARTAAGVPDVAAQFLDRAEARYRVRDGGRAVVAGRPTRAVILTPRESEPARFTRATIWVDDADGLVRRFQTVEAGDLVRTVTILDLQRNPPVDSAEFRFVPPEGVRVFDAAAM